MGAMLDYLDGWVRDYQGPPEVVVGVFHGRKDGECEIRWVSAEGPSAVGNLTLWCSGEVAIEIHDSRTGADLLTHRGRVATLAELGVHLDELVCRSAGTARLGSDRVGRSVAPETDTGPSVRNRRLRLDPGYRGP